MSVLTIPGFLYVLYASENTFGAADELVEA